ncbi:CBS domain-containing protein [Syntrophobacter fumaroxidans]|uniref:Putative signal-transduction protein with CBS domains n=1 Tax=Syntrophobacter fumaroxidans (strain DSM 10017 / MPOB) TaxID=335543 RepID=A0LLQ6_SYNFM|nr:CBS domain-containing protein [Syntrophobacter fumaroxidans]ABK18358.1 putative signal-transduction protein with CBS domains [Syntrophobacter fumaroxidans MPOB]HOI95650.1 CBS domain-containing protein [Syntrophobacter fumaroxidans]
MEARVMSLMRRGAVTCTENMSVREVAQIMVVNRIYYCVVVNEDHEVLGVISARSILRGFGMDLDRTKAGDILLHYTVTITPRSPLKEAINLMCRRKIEHLIVVSDHPGSKTILGLLHAEDIVARMATE